MKKATLKDIAEKFEVSISTISKALRDSDEISEATRLKVQEYAKLINYRPNLNALSLKNRKTRTIGILIPDMLDYFLAQALKGIEKVALEEGYRVVICITNDSFAKEVETIEMLSNGSVDGFIVSISEETELKRDFSHLKDTISFNLPIVMLDRVADIEKCDKVITDNHEAAEDAVKKLAKSGCKHIGFASSISHLSMSDDMLQGYLDGLKDIGLDVNADHIVNKREDHYSGYNEMLLPLFEDGKMDSIIATNEAVALEAMKIAQNKGLNVPKDFSVIGFSNGILARHSNPKLTTISQHGETMGRTAAKILIDKLESQEEKKDVVTKIINTDIIERNTTKLIK